MKLNLKLELYNSAISLLFGDYIGCIVIILIFVIGDNFIVHPELAFRHTRKIRSHHHSSRYMSTQNFTWGRIVEYFVGWSFNWAHNGVSSLCQLMCNQLFNQGHCSGWHLSFRNKNWKLRRHEEDVIMLDVILGVKTNAAISLNLPQVKRFTISCKVIYNTLGIHEEVHILQDI